MATLSRCSMNLDAIPSLAQFVTAEQCKNKSCEEPHLHASSMNLDAIPALAHGVTLGVEAAVKNATETSIQKINAGLEARLDRIERAVSSLASSVGATTQKRKSGADSDDDDDDNDLVNLRAAKRSAISRRSSAQPQESDFEEEEIDLSMLPRDYAKGEFVAIRGDDGRKSVWVGKVTSPLKGDGLKVEYYDTKATKTLTRRADLENRKFYPMDNVVEDRVHLNSVLNHFSFYLTSEYKIPTQVVKEVWSNL